MKTCASCNEEIPTGIGELCSVCAIMHDDDHVDGKVNNDPYYNLMGALYDLKKGTNDQVVWNTIERVLKQIKELQKRENTPSNSST